MSEAKIDPPARVGALSFQLDGDWGPATVVVVGPKPSDPLPMSAVSSVSYRPNIVFNVERAHRRSLQQFADETRERLQAQMSRFSVIREESTEAGGLPAVLREQSFVDLSGFHLQQLELLVVVDERKLLHGLASAHVGDQFAQCRDALERMLLSVALVRS